MSYNHITRKSSGFNPIELYEEYKSKWWWFVVSVIVCCGLAYLYSLRKNPIYEVSANVLISQQDGGDGSQLSKMFSMGDMFGGYSSVDDELMVMSSHTVLRQAVKDLQLNKNYYVKENLLVGSPKYKDAPVEIFYEPSIADTLKYALVFRLVVSDKEDVDVRLKVDNETVAEEKNQKFPISFDTPYGLFVFNKTKYFEPGESFKEYISISNYNQAAEAVASMVEISIPNKKANMILLDVNGPIIAQSKDLLNKIVEIYNQFGVSEKQQKGIKTAEFIDSRLESLSKELDSSEEAVEKYKENNKLTDIRAEATYLMEKRGEVEKTLVAAEANYEVLQMTRKFITDPENRYSLIPTGSLGSESAAAEAIKSYNALVLQRMTLENNAKGDNAALKNLTTRIDAMRENIFNTIEKAAESSSVRLRELRRQANESMSQLGNIPRQEREYINIKRQQSVKEQLFMYLLRQREETALSIANSVPRGIIVDEAFAYFKPISMTRKRMLLLAFVLGLVIPVGILYLRNRFKSKFESRAELENHTKVPILGEICTVNTSDKLVVKDSSTVAELFRLMRANLQFMLTPNKDKVILVTSTIPGEGKSFMSVNLAGTMALMGKKVLLVGMDIRKPQLGNYLGISTEPGLTQYLASDQYTLSDIIQKDAVMKNMDVIVAGKIPPNPAELLMSTKIDDMFAQLRQEYDFIVVDTAPVGMVSDTYVLDRISDATVYVCRVNHTTFNDVKFINAVYGGQRLKKMSLIVNGTTSKKGYGYGYGHDEKQK